MHYIITITKQLNRHGYKKYINKEIFRVSFKIATKAQVIAILGNINFCHINL